MDRCSICNTILKEGERDIHALNRAYELPYEVEWNGTDVTLRNRVVNCICERCCSAIVRTMKGLMQGEGA